MGSSAPHHVPIMFESRLRSIKSLSTSGDLMEESSPLFISRKCTYFDSSNACDLKNQASLIKNWTNMSSLQTKRQSPMSLTSKSKRARWYSIKIEVSPDEEDTEEEGDPVLVLKHFSRVPYISFDKVELGSSKVVTLLVKNPLKSPQKVLIKKFPHKKGFSIESLNFNVEPHQEFKLNILWTPSEASVCREIVAFHTNIGCRTRAILLGTAFAQSKKVKKNVKRVLSPRNDLKQYIRNLHSIQKKNLPTNKSVVQNLTCDEEGKENEVSLVTKKPFIVDQPPQEQSTLQHSIEKQQETNILKSYESMECPQSPLRRQTFLINNMFCNISTVRSQADLPGVAPFAVYDYNLDMDNKPSSLKPTCKAPPPSEFRGRFDMKSTPMPLDCDLRRETFIKDKISFARSANEDFNYFPTSNVLQDSLVTEGNSLLDNKSKLPVVLASKDISSIHDNVTFRDKYANTHPEENFHFFLGNVDDNDFKHRDCSKINKLFHSDIEEQKSKCFLKTVEEADPDKKSHNYESDIDECTTNDSLCTEEQVIECNKYFSFGDEESEISPFVSHEDVRLSSGTIIIENPVISESMLPLHNTSCDREEKPMKPLNDTQNAIFFESEGKDITHSIESGDIDLGETAQGNFSAMPLRFATFCESVVEDGEIPDEVRRCSSGIKPNPPKLNFSSNYPSIKMVPCFEVASISTEEKNLPSSEEQYANLKRTNSNSNEVCPRPHEGTAQCKTVVVGSKLKFSGKRNIKAEISQNMKCRMNSISPKLRVSKSPATLKNRNLGRIMNRSKDRRTGESNSNVKLNYKKGLNAKIPFSTKGMNQKIPGVAQRTLSLVKSNKSGMICHPNPFATKNMYYDERWMEKQEIAFTRWMNFILTPPEELNSNEIVKVDAAKIWLESMKDTGSVKAPTKEDMSLKTYTAVRRLNNLRKISCILYQSQSVIAVIKKIEAEIEMGRLLIRKDRAMHMDVGIKQKVLSFLLCYNPLWLRIGLETIYGELIPLQSNSDVIGLSHFLIQKLLNNPHIAMKYAHPSVPHLFKPGFEEEMKKFILKKFLLLVLFLDVAKSRRLIDYDPCLFCKNAEFKTSRDLLLAFSREFLSGEGDITRHLRYLGYSVSHQQTALDEFDFAVTNIAIDLRCGLRLLRILELILQSWDLSAKARIPCISRLQKIHNNDIVIQAFTEAGYEVEGKITSKDIVDGHREKTLSLLWQIVFKTQISRLLDKKKLEEEIKFLKGNIQLKADLAAFDAIRKKNNNPEIKLYELDIQGLYAESEILTLLLKWCQVVCAHYNVKVSNFTMSFSDGRALCYLLHHYLPSVLPKCHVKQITTLSYFEEQEAQDELQESNFGEEWNYSYMHRNCDQSVMEKIWGNERENLKLAFEKFQEIGGIPILSRPSDFSNTIPDEKVVITLVAYMNSRLMDLSQEIRAARIIQLAWRKKQLNKEMRKLKSEISAAVVLQRTVRKFLMYRRFLRQQNAAILIQSAWRMYEAKRRVKAIRHVMWVAHVESKAVIIQTLFRGYIARKNFKQKKHAAVQIQSIVRMWAARSIFLSLKKRAIIIQQYYRAYVVARKQRQDYVRIRERHIHFQALVRSFLFRRKLAKMKTSAVIIQSVSRSWIARKNFINKKNAVLQIQNKFRATLLRNALVQKYGKIKKSVLLIQSYCRGKMARKEVMRRTKSIITLQAFTKGYLLRRKLNKMKQAATIIQFRWRATVLTQKTRTAYLVTKQRVIVLQSLVRMHITSKKFKEKKRAVVVLQRYFRGFLAKRAFRKIKRSVLYIHSWWHSLLLVRKERTRYLDLKNAARRLQSQFKMLMIRRKFVELKQTVLKIEEIWLTRCIAVKQRQEFLKLKKYVIVIQAIFRGYILRKSLVNIKQAAILIQSVFRCYRARKYFLKKRSSAISIQKHFRSYILFKREYHEYLVMKRGFTKLQAVFRGKKLRREITHLHACAFKLQSVYKAWVTRKSFLGLKHACVMVQQRYREKLIARKEMEIYNCIKKSTIKIQSLIRQFLAKKRYQMFRLSAIIIQKNFRRFSAKRKYDIYRSSCVKVQAQIRMYLQKKQYLTLQKSVIFLQVRYRNKVKMHVLRQRYLEVRKSCIILQSYVKCMIAKKSFCRKKKACVTIQAFVRMAQQQAEYKNMRNATFVIQRRFRENLLSKKERSMFLKIKRACIILQSFFRMFLERRKYFKVRNSAMLLQCWYRASTVARMQRQAYLNLRNKCIVLQAFFRKVVAQKTYLRTLKSSIIIQKYIRGFISRKKYKKLKKSIICLQRFARHWKSGLEVRKRYLRMRQSAIMLQSQFRGFLIRQKIRKERGACICIQSHFKTYIARKRFIEYRKYTIIIQRHYQALKLGQKTRSEYLWKRKSIIVIQSLIRCYIQRKLFKKIINAAVIIQTRFRSWIMSKKLYTEYQHIRNASITIQSFWRMYFNRKNYVQLKSIIKLQSLFRMHRIQQNFFRQRRSAITIQSCIRQYMARKKYLLCRKKIIYVQRTYRAKMERRKLYILHEKKIEASICIQSWWRGCLQRQHLLLLHKMAAIIQASYTSFKIRRNFLLLKKSALAIQKFWRGYQQTKTQRNLFLSKCRSAILIQHVFRQHIREKWATTVIQNVMLTYHLRQKFKRMKICAIRIQTWYRGITQYKIFVKAYKAVLCLQLHVRAYIIGSKERRKYIAIHAATIKIQAFVRGYFTRREFQKILSARIIQVWYRGAMQRRYFIQTRRKIILIQTIYRGYRVKRKYLLLKRLTVIVQQRWRSILESKRSRSRRLKAAIIIQKNYRRYKVLKGYLQTLSLIVKLQSYVRGNLIRQNSLLRRIKAAIVVQRAIRSYFAKKQLKAAITKRQRRLRIFVALAMYNLSAVRIQRCYRRFCLLKYGYQNLSSIIVIQQWFRAKLQRLWFLRFLSSIRTFQKAALEYVDRRSKAAIQIQSFVKCWILHQNFCKMKAAAIVIQTTWRGYKLRCTMQSKSILAIRKRIRIAKATATKENALGNRVSTALDFLLKYSSLSHMLSALKHLDAATRLSSKCCERLVDAGGHQKMMHLINSCNRSLPHMELIKYSTNILLNLAKYEKTVDSIWEIPGSVATILELMSIFREKGSIIFTKCCTLLWILCQKESRAEEIKKNEQFTAKICSCHYLLSRKQKMEKQRQLVKAKIPPSSSFLCTSMSSICSSKETPQIRPDWNLCRHVMHEFEDPLKAITSVMKTLCLKNKEHNVGRNTIA